MRAVPPLPSSFRRKNLEACGFVGWLTWARLCSGAFTAIPQCPAAYAVYRQSDGEPVFLKANPGFHFKKKDPTVAQDALRGRWVADCNVVYIGKADDTRE